MKQHPVIEALFVNENGTRIVYHDKELKVKQYAIARNTCPRKIVNFMNRTHSVPKLVCETYQGMRKDASYTVQRKDFDPNNDHYTNLFWGKRGGRIATGKSKRSKLSKLKKTDIPVIVSRLNRGETLKAIAASYGTSDMTILRIKKEHISQPIKVLKNAVIVAQNKEQRLSAFANYLGYKSPGTAILNMGKHEFLTQVDQLSQQL